MPFDTSAAFKESTPQPHETGIPRRTEFGFEDLTQEDVDLLIDSTKNLYEYALQIEDAASGVGRSDAEAASVLDQMNETVIELEGFVDLLPLSEEEYARMVELYDGLKADVRKIEALYHDFILDDTDASEGVDSVLEADPEISSPATLESVQQEAVTQGDEERAPEPAVVAQLQERAADFKEEVTWTRERLYSLFPKEHRTPETRTLLKELDVSVQRTEQLAQDMSTSDDRALFDRMQTEIRENVAVIDEALQRLKDQLASTEKDAVAKDVESFQSSESSADDALPTNANQAVSSSVDGPEDAHSVGEATAHTLEEFTETPTATVTTESSPAPVSELAESQASSPETISPVENNEDISVVPDEAEVALLMRRVSESQFYTEEERTTAHALYEAYHRSVAEAQPINVQRRSYQNLHEFIMNLSDHPSAEYIEERANRIIDRIEAGARAENATLFETAKAMRLMIARVKEDKAKSEDDLVLAYRNLERFAVENESEWITIAGMHPPHAGPEGVFGARSLREGLMLMRDRHRELQRHPRKRLLVDKMIRMLAYVPKEGLSREDVTELIRLMREVDVPEGLMQQRSSEPSEVQPETKQRETVAGDAPLKMTTLHGVIVPVKGEAKAHFVRAARSGLIQLFDTWKHDESRTAARAILSEMIEVTRLAAGDVLSPEQTDHLSELVQRLRTLENTAPTSEVSEVAEVSERKRSGRLAVSTDDAGEAVPIVVKNTDVERSQKEQVSEAVSEIEEGANEERSQAMERELDTVTGAAEEPREAEPVSIATPVEEIPLGDNAAALEQVEQRDPVNQAVPIPRPTVRSWQERQAERTIVPMEGLKAQYPQFFERVDASELNRVLRAEVNAHEQKYVQRLDTLLGFTRRPAFDYIKQMSLSELDELMQVTTAADRETLLLEQNVIYDSLVQWYDMIPEMTRLVRADDDMHFGDLFARFIIEQEIGEG